MSEHFGEWLKRQIEERLLTQRQFAESSGIHYWTLRNWIIRESPSIRGVNLVRLSRALGMSREALEELLHRCHGAAAA